MQREIYNRLREWKLSTARKPLMLYGARQVGKTYILKEFGRQEYGDVVYVNCFKNDIIAQLYQQDKDVNRIVLGLSAYANRTIVPGKTLIILDEVQEVPAAVSALKYFAEDAPDIHIAVAGSLLGVMNMEGESFPVGKVDILHLFPMTYHEFLLAMGQEALAGVLAGTDLSMASVFATRFEELLRQYYFTGGMPEAVQAFALRHDPREVRDIQNSILASYMTDIAKHTQRDALRIRMVWDSIPSQLAKENKRFVFGAVRKGARAADFEIAIQWLVDAGLVYKVGRVSKPGMPLKFYVDNNSFKLYLLDVGLLGALASAPPVKILIGDNIFNEYKGAFTENYVIQQLRTLADMPVCYFSKENSMMEVDFVAQTSLRVVPIEVKAEENTKAKSLRMLVQHEFPELHLHAVRFSMMDYKVQDWMTNVPLYAVREYMSEQ